MDSRASRCRVLWGPLQADAAEGAARLPAALSARPEPGANDLPGVNRPAVALAEGLGMGVVFESARMYSGPTPGMALERMLGATSFEVG